MFTVQQQTLQQPYTTHINNVLNSHTTTRAW